MEALFEDDEEPFLSVEADSVEIYPYEEPPTSRKEVNMKRKPEEAFPDSPSDELQALASQVSKRRNDEANSGNKFERKPDDPKSTSSPKRPPHSPKLESQTPRRDSYSDTSNPLSQVVTLDERTGAIEKKKNTGIEDDGQHKNEENCGCHQCIKKLSIIKQEKIVPGREISTRLREQINKRRLFKHTPLRTHPELCLCRSHLERSHPAPNTPLPKDQGFIETIKNQVSNLRSKFEPPAARIDPRTGVPPEPAKSNKDAPTNTIPVHTSR